MQGKLSDRMLPAPVGSGFEMDGYWVWDGSVIKGEDGRYHMFASRWPKIYPMHPGWMIASEVVRASCDTPDGKYEFEEVVLPARGPQYWDGRATHNPQITKQGWMTPDWSFTPIMGIRFWPSMPQTDCWSSASGRMPSGVC